MDWAKAVIVVIYCIFADVSLLFMSFFKAKKIILFFFHSHQNIPNCEQMEISKSKYDM